MLGEDAPFYFDFRDVEPSWQSGFACLEVKILLILLLSHAAVFSPYKETHMRLENGANSCAKIMCLSLSSLFVPIAELGGTSIRHQRVANQIFRQLINILLLWLACRQPLCVFFIERQYTGYGFIGLTYLTRHTHIVWTSVLNFL